jgi:hypothetical protein
MPLDAPDVLASVIAALLRRLRRFDALCVHDAKRRLGRPPVGLALLPDLIFLMPVPASWCRLPLSDCATDRSSSVRYSILGNHREWRARYSHSSAGTESHKRHRINRLPSGWSCAGRFPACLGSTRTGPG